MDIITQNVEDLIDRWLEAEQKGDRFPVPFDIAWEIAGYKQKPHAKRRLLSKSSHLKKDMDYTSRSGRWSQNGRSSDRILLSCDAFKQFCLMAETDQGRQVRQYFIECEKKWRIVQKIAPDVAMDVEILKLKAEIAKNEAIKAKAEEKTLALRHLVVSTCPEPIQQKVLGYQVVEKIEYRDRIIKDSEILNDGSCATKTELCHRYGILTRNGKPDYKRLNDVLDRSPIGSTESAWRVSVQFQESKLLVREYLPELDRWFEQAHRQLWVGE